jgi:acylglycerol lipase
MEFVNKIKGMYPETPTFCLGLSMGGLASYYVSSMHTDYFKGAILMAPALKNQVSGLVVGVSKFLKKLLPEHTTLMGPVYGRASRNPAITDFVKQDPYAYKGKVNLATTSFLVNTMDSSPASFKNYRCPFLIIQGGLDKLVNPMVAFDLFTQSPLPEKDKDILFYYNMWHDIWH